MLTSFYEYAAEVACERMRGVIAFKGVRTEDAANVLRALDLHGQKAKLHFVDAYLTALAEEADRGVATFDKLIETMKLVPVLNVPNDEA